jgi:hypothetical protein
MFEIVPDVVAAYSNTSTATYIRAPTVTAAQISDIGNHKKSVGDRYFPLWPV